jgi:single-strand DNA-binding protein
VKKKFDCQANLLNIMNFNKAFVLGNLTRDPETRALPSGQPFTSFSIATNRYYTDTSGQRKEEVEFHNIVAFGKLADIVSRYLTKGSMVLIEGRIKTRNWTDQAGVKHWKTEIIAEGLQMGPKSSTGGSGGSQSNYSPKSFNSQPEPSQPKEADIPIIEENYTPPADSMPSSSDISSDIASDEIDVKDIPF